MMAMAGALLLVAATGGNAIAQTVETGQTRRVRQTRLELTDAQKEQIAQLQEQHREASAEAAAERIKARAEVQSLMVQTDTDLNALQRAMNKLSELENAQKIQRMKNLQAYSSLLTDEQKSQIRSGRGAGMSLFMQGRMGDGQAFRGRGNSFQGRRGNFTGGRGQQGRFTQGRNMGSRGNRGNNRGFGRVGRSGAAHPPMQGRFGKVNPSESGMRMRARIHVPGSALPPPSAPPPPPID